MGAVSGSSLTSVMCLVSATSNNMNMDTISARERTGTKQVTEVCLDHSSTGCILYSKKFYAT